MSFVSKRIASDVSQAIEKEKANKSFVRNLLVSSPSQIWKSKLSWRIALAVFMTILAVQAGILNFTLKQYESDRLNQVRKLGIAAVTPMVDPRAIDPLAPPFTDEQVNRLLSNGEVQGLAVYSRCPCSTLLQKISRFRLQPGPMVYLRFFISFHAVDAFRWKACR